MQYRKYNNAMFFGVLFLGAQAFVACTKFHSGREPSSIESSQQDQDVDGREPASMQGGVGWLDDVGDHFNRIAADTSSRTVASENQKEMLIQQKNWSFSYLPKANHFYVGVQGDTFSMTQTSIGDGETYGFAAEGQAENPVTLSVTSSQGRNVASGELCEVQISYWNEKSHNYVKDSSRLQGESCSRLIKRLKGYVP